MMRGWIHAASASMALLVLVLGCSRKQAEPGTGSPARNDAGPAVAAGLFVPFPAAGVPNADSTLVPRRGIGVIGFDSGPLLAGRAADTIDVLQDSAQNAPVQARMVLDSAGVYRYEARDGLIGQPAALDYGYEQVGFAVAERKDGWVRVLLGQAPDGSPVGGWVRERAGVLAVTMWEDLLPRQPLFFASPDSIRFYAAREGVEKPFPVKDSYILWPLEASGDWMRVRAVTPSNYCSEALAPREDTLWIRWRNPDGEPRVWFYTRGC